METNGQGVDEPLRIRKFEVGDLVFAKLKGYPPWPSKINQIETIISGGKEKTRYNVYFYGTHQSSILRSSSLFHYDTYAKSIVEKWGRKPKFHDALTELEREMMDKITYLNQLRSTTPESNWCHNFSNACENLANEINGAKQKAKSKNHSNIKKPSPAVQEVQDEEVYDIDEEMENESRKLGYEVMYMERIPFPDTPESFIVLSLNFNKEWVKEEAMRIKEEERMMNCHVRIEPFPPEYAHLDPAQALRKEETTRLKSSYDQFDHISKNISEQSKRKLATKEDLRTRTNSLTARDLSSDEEAVETCPVCRLCFFSLADLKNHEKSVHGATLTAESMFDRLMSGGNQATEKKTTSLPFGKKRASRNMVSSWKGGYPLDAMIDNGM